MRKILAFIIKEWLILWRDKTGLLFLFLMPMGLVTFLCLTESGVSDAKGNVKILVLNYDHGYVAHSVINGLKRSSHFKVDQASDPKRFFLQDAKAKVASGEYQASVFIPENASEIAKDRIDLMTEEGKYKPTQESFDIEVILDPTLPAAMAEDITASVELFLQGYKLSAVLEKVKDDLKLSSDKIKEPLGEVKSSYIDLKDSHQKPNTVQQNVPAWSLFGMFFIVIPLAGKMVREREQGTQERLQVAPVSPLTILFGTICAFVLVNLLQLAFMLMAGVTILPWSGLPKLNLSGHYFAVLVTGICAAFAATGFGMLVGSWARTQSQATILGSFLIVIAAAVGGTLVPVYLMPKFLQTISILSPLNWGQSALISIFVRDATLGDIWPDLVRLLAFFVVTLLLSLSAMARTQKQRIGAE